MAGEFSEFDSPFPLGADPALTEWQQSLEGISSSKIAVRTASPVGSDGRKMWDLQLVCSPITVKSVSQNVQTIMRQSVFLAEVGGVHVGRCISRPGQAIGEPLYIQVVAVAPGAQRRGVGSALLSAAAEAEPKRSIALATQDENTGARAMVESFARSLGANVERVKLGTFRDSDLGISRGLGYRAWLVRRP